MMRVSVDLLVPGRPGCSEKWLALVEDVASRSLVLRRVVGSEEEARSLVRPYQS